ncbi:hypothetical protein Q4Q35_20805 [Flavivirga aquimarina]|uniref:Uncharacterized protein n=1 Tax=Flavivirga aquimarina TaxID=2027862 RepID=A0ABT8WGG3_9FLAO|nr:hypothetical protein [Flavivirga aquimarina]MDO5972246.1 hypothetical protein [Flavivirga aquimarina]
MKTAITSNFFCLVYGHNYFRIKEAKTDTPSLVCKCCKKYFMLNPYDDIIEVEQQRSIFLLPKIKKIM